jgi:hypothetical protein
MEDNRLLVLLVVWIATVGIVALVRWRKKEQGVGLTLAYLVNLWLIHWVAVSIYLIPGYKNNDPRLVSLGFEQSVYAVVAFAFGGLALTPLMLKFGRSARATAAHELDSNLPKAYVCVGALSYLALTSALGGLPSASSILASGQQLVVVGLGLCCWQAWRQRNYRMFHAWLGTTLLLPFITIVTRGFIGYGAAAAFSVLIFVSTFVRSRFVVLVAAILLGYLGISVYVTYMRDRGEIREVVWGGQALRDRVERVTSTLENFEWFNPSKAEHLNRIDDRLNQSFFVGAAVSRLSEIGGYAHGSTLWDALLSLIPRALWPEKPVTAGSGTMVTEYTGIPFVAGTSVGIGHVMEFYVNFGTLGVIIGFMIMGILVTVLDGMAAEHLARTDLHGFVLWYLPGLSLLQVGGSLVEVTGSAAASIFVAIVVNKYLERLQRKHAASSLSPVAAGRNA